MVCHWRSAFAIASTFCLICSPASVADAQPTSDAARQSRTYTNPILADGSLADPDVILVDGTYYLYPTSHGAGYDVWTSTDLVSWKPRGSVFKAAHGGAWAPDVFHNKRGDGKFYLYYTDSEPTGPQHGPFNKQIGVAVSDSPTGPFQDKNVLATGSIDAHLFQDDDGRMVLYYVEIANGFKIFGQRMSDPLTKEGEPVELIHPTEPWEMISGHVTEGPFMLKHDGTYYLMYSGTGADSPNYGIGYATSKSPLGPFTKSADNPIVHRSEAGTSPAVFGPGHHCVVTGPDGKLWMIYHQKYDDGTNYRRFLALDPIWFDDSGKLRSRATRGTKEPAPGK
jgi:xylan 1,4-beta-xylosidase